jgi:hypothetical protein
VSRNAHTHAQQPLQPHACLHPPSHSLLRAARVACITSREQGAAGRSSSARSAPMQSPSDPAPPHAAAPTPHHHHHAWWHSSLASLRDRGTRTRAHDAHAQNMGLKAPAQGQVACVCACPASPHGAAPKSTRDTLVVVRGEGRSEDGDPCKRVQCVCRPQCGVSLGCTLSCDRHAWWYVVASMDECTRSNGNGGLGRLVE